MQPRLLSIELQGYKTFANQTNFDFPGMITAIVGPNGSGKSNIADGIRWVLGEQSYSLLRAKKTEDMIFAGSQQRSRAGMASVQIVFNNEDGWLPIDFSEVSLLRKAYRDGQNEYYLNGQKVRLKDINEMLSQTGLAERNYTVIGQGLVDAALSLKPDERRQLFEEAAGIGLYRSRKEEAERRLDTTRRNLDRVLDIIEEIKPRLRSLEKQAEKFIELKQLQADLQLHLRDWYGYHWYKSQKEIQEIQNVFKTQQEKLERTREQNQIVLEKVQNNRTAIKEKRDLLAHHHTELANIHREYEVINRQIAILGERQRAYETQQRQLELDLVNTEEEIKSRQESHDLILTEYKQLQQEYNDIDGQKKSSEQQFLDRKTLRDAIQEKITKLSADLLAKRTEKLQSEAKATELDNRISQLKLELQKHEKNETSNDLQMSELDEKIDALRLEENRLHALLQGNDKALQIIRQQKAERVALIDNIRKDLQAANTQRASLQTQLKLLHEAEESFSGYSETAKKLLQNKKEWANFTALSTFLDVPQKFERAIAAALGDMLDIVIVSDVTSTTTLFDELDSSAESRIALFDLNHSGNAGKPKLDQAIIGIASDLIKCTSAAYKPAIEALLNHVLIVENREAALELRKEIPAHAKLVTLVGEVFAGNGVIVSGKSNAGERVGRKRTINELTEKFNQINQQFDALETQLQQEIDAKNDLDNQESIEIDNKNSSERNLKDIQREVSTLQLKSSQLNQQIEWHREQSQQIRNRMKTTSEEVKVQQERQSRINAAIDEFCQEISLQEKILNDQPIMDLEDQLHHWQTTAAVLNESLTRVKLQLEKSIQLKTESLNKSTQIQQRSTELAQQRSELTQSQETLSQRDESTSSAITNYTEQHIKPLEEALRQFEKANAVDEEQEQTSQRELNIVERQFAQVQLELARKNERLDNLRSKIEDDFGLVSLNYEQNMTGANPLPLSGFVDTLPKVDLLNEKLDDEIKRLKNQIRRIGSVNPEAETEYLSVKERFEFLQNQVSDLNKASEDLKGIIAELDGLMQRDYLKTFKAVNTEFTKMFTRLFNGGEAKLVLIEKENPIDGGIDIEAKLPGKREQGLALLSGGERSLTAVALVFALIKVSPTPFCIMDEVDAMLDESNVGRFCDLLRELSDKTQFILITHNRNTVQAADIIYGITMGKDSSSQMISLKLEDVDQTYVA